MKTKKERKEFLQNNFKISTLNFKWSNSGVCRIYNFRGQKTNYYAGGYGYDKKGTCLAKLMMEYFPTELKKLNSSDYYGLNHYNTKTKKYNKRANNNTRTYLDGACGFESMTPILNKIGFTLKFIYEDNNSTMYRMEVI